MMDGLGETLSRWTDELRKPLWVAAAAVGLVYFLQAFSPLRLNNDNVRLLEMADNFARGFGFGDSFLPAGYPAFVVALDHLGLATPFGVVFSNAVILAVGLYFVYGTVRRLEPHEPAFPAVIVALSLFSYLTVKYTAKPQSEILYFALSAAVLRLAVSTEGPLTRRLFVAAGTLPLAGLALSVRSIGVALFAAPVVAFIVTWTGRPLIEWLSGTGEHPWRRWIIVGGALAAAAGAAFAAAKYGSPILCYAVRGRRPFTRSGTPRAPSGRQSDRRLPGAFQRSRAGSRHRPDGLRHRR